MAENKKSILVYADWISLFEELDDSEAGQLIKHFFRYVNDKNPEPPNRLIKIAFEPIKLTLKRDLKNWEEIIKKRSEAGKASAEKRKQISTKSTHVESVKQTSTNPTDNVSVNVSVSDNVNDNVKEKEIINNNLKFFNFDFCQENLLSIFQEWILNLIDTDKTKMTQLRVESCWRQFKEFSELNPEKARKIVDKSISGGHKTLYAITDTKQILQDQVWAIEGKERVIFSKDKDLLIRGIENYNKYFNDNFKPPVPANWKMFEKVDIKLHLYLNDFPEWRV